MSDEWGQEGTAAFAGQPAANDAVTAGSIMRRAREAAGLHVAALAVSLKVPVRKLEALEDDRWDELPDAVFVRGLAASVCRALKLDPQPVLERLPQSTAPRLLQASDGINTTFRAPSDGSVPAWREQLTRPVFLVVVALLIGALALLLLPSIQQDDPATVAGSSRQAQPPQPQQVTAAVPSLAQPSASAISAQAAAPSAAASGSLAAAPAPALAGASAARVAAAASAPNVPVAAAAVPASAGDIVVFRTRHASWVEVTDAKGVVAVRRLLGAGEAAGASGALPLQVTIGRVDATEVEVRGKPFDLGPVSHDNVARFEVK